MQGGRMQKLISTSEEIIEYLPKIHDASKFQVKILTKMSRRVAQLSKNSMEPEFYPEKY